MEPPCLGRTGTAGSEDTLTHLDNQDQEYRQAREDFFRVLPQFERIAECGRKFYLARSLARHLQESAPPRLQSTPDVPKYGWKSCFDRLWKTAFYRLSVGPPQVMEREIWKCTNLFFILLELDQPAEVCTFRQHGLNDDSLPLSREDLNDVVLRWSTGSTLHDSGSRTEFIEGFLQKQYAWCPMRFELGMETRNPRNRILPFYEKTLMPRVGSRVSPHNTTIWVVDIPEELVDDDLKATLPNARRNESPRGRDKSEKEETFRFALKQFPGNRLEAFHHERSTQKALAGRDGVIHYVGCFRYSRQLPPASTPDAEADPPSHRYKEYFCLVLELGNFDFNKVMLEEQPPDLPHEIRSWWKKLGSLASALVGIHGFEIDGTTYHGWHGDIKPDNILFVQGQYKLCDPGEALIRRETNTKTKVNLPRAKASGGTRSYAAPEKSAYLDPNNREKPENRILQNSDVWSLGTVLSVAATFLVLGRQGVASYEKIRKLAIGELAGPPPTAGDAFHDGSAVLPCVVEWHRYLRSICRQSDSLTSRVLDIVDEVMLQPEGKRGEATVVEERFKQILAEETKDAPEFPEILKYLKKIDTDAELQPSSTLTHGEDQSANSDPRFRGLETQPWEPPVAPFACQSSEDLLRSQTIQPTSQRNDRNPTSLLAHEGEGEVQWLRKVYSDPHKREPNVVHAPRSAAGSRNQRGQPSALARIETHIEHVGGTKTLTSDVRNWCEVEDELERCHTSHGVRGSLHGIANASSFRQIGRAICKPQQDAVRNNTISDDALEGRYFKDRDLIFLVDNCSTMARHWNEAKYLLRVLAWRSLGYDDDGHELHFTNPSTKARVLPSESQVVSHFCDAMDEARPTGDVHTSIVTALTGILHQHEKSQTNAPRRKRTVIILTDGIWEESVYNHIRKFIKSELEALKQTHSGGSSAGTGSGGELLTQNLNKTRPLSFQFVRFGHDRSACGMLQELDDGLEAETGLDLVDTEPSYGDVHKMLLGSIDPSFDVVINGANSTLPVASPRSVGSEPSPVQFC